MDDVVSQKPSLVCQTRWPHKEGRQSILRDIGIHGLRVPTAVAKFPFFALAPVRSAMHFTQRSRTAVASIKCDPVDGSNVIATLNDLEIIVMITSILAGRLNRGEDLEAPVVFRAGDVLGLKGAKGSGRQHKLIASSVERLAKTRVSAQLDATGSIYEFRWLEDVKLQKEGRSGWCITPPRWLVREVKEHRMIKIEPAFFGFRGMQRRLYLWAKSYVSAKPGFERFSMSFADAHAKAGSADELSKFAHELKRHVTNIGVVDRRLSVADNGQTQQLIIEHCPEQLGATASLDVPGDRATFIPFPDDSSSDLVTGEKKP